MFGCITGGGDFIHHYVPLILFVCLTFCMQCSYIVCVFFMCGYLSVIVDWGVLLHICIFSPSVSSFFISNWILVLLIVCHSCIDLIVLSITINISFTFDYISSRDCAVSATVSLRNLFACSTSFWKLIYREDTVLDMLSWVPLLHYYPSTLHMHRRVLSSL